MVQKGILTWHSPPSRLPNVQASCGDFPPLPDSIQDVVQAPHIYQRILNLPNSIEGVYSQWQAFLVSKCAKKSWRVALRAVIWCILPGRNL